MSPRLTVFKKDIISLVCKLYNYGLPTPFYIILSNSHVCPIHLWPVIQAETNVAKFGWKAKLGESLLGL